MEQTSNYKPDDCHIFISRTAFQFLQVYQTVHSFDSFRRFFSQSSKVTFSKPFLPQSIIRQRKNSDYSRKKTIREGKHPSYASVITKASKWKLQECSTFVNITCKIVLFEQYCEYFQWVGCPAGKYERWSKCGNGKTGE